MKNPFGRKENPTVGIGEEVLKNQIQAKQDIDSRIAHLYDEIESAYERILSLKDSVPNNSLLELMIIHRRLQFPTQKPQLPVLNLSPLKLKEPSVDKFGAFLNKLTVFALNFSKKDTAASRITTIKEEIESKRILNLKKRREYYEEVTAFKDSLLEDGGLLLADLNETKTILEALLSRLEGLVTIINNDFSTLGPQFIAGESSEPETVFTLPASCKFSISSGNNTFIKIGAATERQLKDIDEDIPQIRLKVENHIKGGTISWSIEIIGGIPLEVDINKNVPFVEGTLGQKASIEVYNDLSPLNGQSQLKNTIKIPYSFATSEHLVQEIVLKVYSASQGTIILKPSDILQAFALVGDLKDTHAAKKIGNILSSSNENGLLHESWADSGGSINADLLDDMGLLNLPGVSLLSIMLRSGAIQTPWHYVVSVLAVSEGRSDLLEELSIGAISPSDLFLHLDASSQNVLPVSNGAIHYLDGDLNDDEYDVDPSTAIELSPQGSEILNIVDNQRNYTTGNLVPLKKAVQIILNPDFQKGLLDVEKVKERKQLKRKIGLLVTSVRSAKLEMVAAELSLELDSLERALILFEKEAKNLSPQIAQGISELMIARAKNLSLEIPELSQTNNLSNSRDSE